MNKRYLALMFLCSIPLVTSLHGSDEKESNPDWETYIPKNITPPEAIEKILNGKDPIYSEGKPSAKELAKMVKNHQGNFNEHQEKRLQVLVGLLNPRDRHDFYNQLSNKATSFKKIEPIYNKGNVELGDYGPVKKVILLKRPPYVKGNQFQPRDHKIASTEEAPNNPSYSSNFVIQSSTSKTTTSNTDVKTEQKDDTSSSTKKPATDVKIKPKKETTDNTEKPKEKKQSYFAYLMSQGPNFNSLPNSFPCSED